MASDNPDVIWPCYAPFEVVVHNTADDCWLSFLGKVVDVTPLIEEHRQERCVLPLIAMAGKDVSHWFDERTGDIQHYIHPETGVKVPYCPHGPVPDVSVEVPATDWRPVNKPPWWKDEKYQVGVLTKRVRPIRIINMLCPFFREVQLNVCCEDTFSESRRDTPSSTVTQAVTHGDVNMRYTDRAVIMSKTLDENGIPDERDLFTDLGLPQTYYIPSIFLYYNDDLKYFNFVDDEDESHMYDDCYVRKRIK
ncbi:hypothetical protein NQ318_020693 [Aromia moschata]|uniref:Cytochrome b5 domain-containing protein 1 n=1 Tax=Aromia moschata TaxID=1265417 RepID=A0AAV8XQ00_9CUCU|nr:hypothetical protein NQ318_020693 [Aromia moschata]